MVDRVGAGDRLPHPLGVAEIGLDQLDLLADPEQVEARGADAADVGGPRAGPVEHPDILPALEQGPGEVRADEAMAAGDQRQAHSVTPVPSQVLHGGSPEAQRSLRTTASL